MPVLNAKVGRDEKQHIDHIHLLFITKVNIPTFVAIDMASPSIYWLIKNDKCTSKSSIDKICFACRSAKIIIPFMEANYNLCMTSKCFSFDKKVF